MLENNFTDKYNKWTRSEDQHKVVSRQDEDTEEDEEEEGHYIGRKAVTFSSGALWLRHPTVKSETG